MEKKDYKNIKRYTILICDDCINLKGKACNNPACCFCRKSIDEIDTALEDTGIIAKVVNYKQTGKPIKT